jgi:hypothetical protein
MENPSTEVLRELNRTKNMLLNLRRAIWPQREAVVSKEAIRELAVECMRTLLVSCVKKMGLRG